MEILKLIIRMKIYRLRNKITKFLIENNLVNRKYGEKLVKSNVKEYMYLIMKSKKYI